MSGLDVFAAAMIGIAAGWIADLARPLSHSLFLKLLMGVIGAFAGAFIAQRLALPLPGPSAPVVGAVLFLAVLGLIRRPA